MVAMYWRELPSRVPAHFGPAGTPDRWSGKNILLALPLLGLVMYVSLTITSRLTHHFNLPDGFYRENPAVAQLLTELMVTIKAIALLTFAYIEWASIQTAIARRNGLGPGFLPLAVACATAVPLFYVVKIRRCRS